jgi:hypothetical protein
MNAKAHLLSISCARSEYQADTRRGTVFGASADTWGLASASPCRGSPRQWIDYSARVSPGSASLKSCVPPIARGLLVYAPFDPLPLDRPPLHCWPSPSWAHLETTDRASLDRWLPS